MVLVQKLPFFQLFFLRQYRPEKCVLSYSRTKKLLSRLKKKKKEVQKVEKLRLFPKGFTHGFGPKIAILLKFFQLFLSHNIGQKNVFYDILERNNAFLGYKKKKLKKSKNGHFSKGVNLWFWSKNGHFSHFFIKQYRLGKCLLRYSLERKIAFLGYKKKKLKKSKN